MLKFGLILALFSACIAISESRNVVCYFASWTIYRPDNGKFQASDVDPNLCTHILYSFVGLNEDGTVHVLDDWEATGLKEIAHLVGLKKANPKLKVFLSMGGWNEGSEKYSRVAKDAGKRQTMANSVLSYIKDHGFDGFDLDWEYPTQRGGDEQADKANFVTLIRELRDALHAKNYQLSAAVSGGVKTIQLAYDVPAVSEALDMINVMTYDYHGAFEPFVGHYAPLRASHLDKTDEQKTLNVESGIQFWLDQGADPSKINVGVGTYGRSFTLANPANTELYAPTSGGGHAGPYTRQEGVLGYNEICEFHSDWQYVWDDEQRVPHRISGDQWVGYDDTRSAGLKGQFAKDKNLGGIIVWSLDTDDFRGLCGQETYPVIRAAVNNLNEVPIKIEKSKTGQILNLAKMYLNTYLQIW